MVLSVFVTAFTATIIQIHLHPDHSHALFRTDLELPISMSECLCIKEHPSMLPSLVTGDKY